MIPMRPGSSCCNHAELIQRFMSDSAYDVIKYVAENYHYIKYVFDFLHASKVLFCVESTSELAAIDLDTTRFARLYVRRRDNKPQYVDYIFLEDMDGGIKPKDTNRRGSWIAIEPSTGGIGNPAYGARPLCIYCENHQQQDFYLGDLIGQELIGIKEVYVQGVRQQLNDDFTYDPNTYIMRLLRRPARMGEQIVMMMVGAPTIPGTAEGDFDGYTMQTWTYNAAHGGRAIGDGSEVLIRIDLPYNHITNVFHNGRRLAHELKLECHVLPGRGGIELFEPLKKGDIFQVQLGGYFGNVTDTPISIEHSIETIDVGCKL